MLQCVQSAAELKYQSEADTKLEATLIKHKKGKLKKDKNKSSSPKPWNLNHYPVLKRKPTFVSISVQ